MHHLLFKRTILTACFYSFGIAAIFSQGMDPGNYRGILQTVPLYSADTLEVFLKVNQINDTAWNWSMKMGELIQKDYTLHRFKTDSSRWLMDEYNGIYLTGSMSENQLHFMYSLDSIFYSVIYTFSPNRIDFQIYYYDIKKGTPNVSGQFTVMDYVPKGRQYAVLKKTGTPAR